MTTALIVLAAAFVWVSALATWSLTRQFEALVRGRGEERAAWRAETEEFVGMLGEELTANRAAHEDTMRMVLAGYERLVYPATVQTEPPIDGHLVSYADLEAGVERRGKMTDPRARPPMPGADDPAVTGEFDGVVAEEPAFLGLPLDGIPEDALHAARIEAMYSAPVEPMPEAAGPQGAVMMDVEDPDPFGIGADTREQE